VVDRDIDAIVEDDPHVGGRLVEMYCVDEIVRRACAIHIDLERLPLDLRLLAGILGSHAAVAAKQAR
jgi:hypothetical protein